MIIYLDLADVANQLGVYPGTARRDFASGKLPPPDAVVGSGTSRRYGWLPSTVDAAKYRG